jgi:hypothetical protein
VSWVHWTRADIESKLQGLDLAKFGHMYDINNPGYTFGAISHLSPVKVRFDGKNMDASNDYPATMKRNMLCQPMSADSGSGWTKEHPALARDYKRLAPFTYIKMRCIHGRLWLDEVGSDTARE